LELAVRVVRVQHRTVQQDARIAAHVALLRRPADEAERKLAAHDSHLDGRDARSAVPPDRPEQHEAVPVDPLAACGRQLRRPLLEVAPRGHRGQPEPYNRGVDFETRAIHDGQEPDPATGAVTVPIYQTSTFVQDAVGETKGYDYARTSNPTRTALQLCLASLEGAEHGVAFSSGLGAVTTIMHLLNPGDRVVAVADVYGGVYRMFSQVYEPKGYEFEWVPAEELNADPAARLDDRTRIVWLETPTNPMLNVV